MFKLSTGCLAISVTAALTGCASPPPTSLAQARSDMNTALNAPPNTYSPAQFNEAQFKLSQAESAAEDEDMEAADMLSEEALADLRLSRAQADVQQAQGTTGGGQSPTVRTRQNDGPVTLTPPATLQPQGEP